MKKFFNCLLILSFLASAAFPNPATGHADGRPRLDTGRNGEPRVQEDRGIVALDQALRDLSNPYSVMCLAVRPEDADWGTLAYYRKRYGARAVAVFVTRGESAPSSSAQDPGVERTRAALRAARLAGSDVYFLNLPDAGPARSADEAVAAWGHDEALRRTVRALRLLRPDVIITNHRSSSAEGQQRAAARLLLEAFDAAPEADRFPVEGTSPWQARRVFQRTMVNEGEVAIDLNEYDRVRGTSYNKIGLAAVDQTLPQDSPPPDRSGKVFYKLVKSSTGESARYASPLFDGLVLPENLVRSITPPRVGDLLATEALALRERLVDALRDRLLEKRAEGTAEVLLGRYGSEFFRVIRYTEALERALALALGIGFDIELSDSLLVPGQKVSARLVLRNGSERALPVVFNAPEQLPGKEGKPAYGLSDVVEVPPGGGIEKEFQYEVPKDAGATLPRSAHLYDENYYPVGSALPGTQMDEPFGARFIGFAQIGISQATITIPVLKRFDISPSVEIATIPFAVLRDWSKPREISFSVRVRNRTPGPLAGRLWVVPLALSVEEYQPVRVDFAEEDEEIAIRMNLKLPILKPPLTPDILLEFRRDDPSQTEALGSARIAVKALEFNLAEGLKVGYISGPDHSLSEALGQLGVEHSEIPIDELSPLITAGDEKTGSNSIRACDLSRFDTIIIDSRALSAHPRLASASECLSGYSGRGGNLVILAQDSPAWNSLAVSRQLSPHAIKLSTERLGPEPGAFKIIEPEHALLLRPNKITDRDFENWNGLRATDLPGEWAADYRALLEWTGGGGKVEKGALLVAQSGAGSVIYTSLDLKAQMLALNPGAFRIFSNLIGYRK
ncbi:MAG TPA: PIG-L family deacetylase [Blastocatellia bacterium]|nr:PIG-L family deacetylase [Blastocatellia bacterium]